MIEREKVLANNLLIGDKDSPVYSYKNRNLRSGSLKGSFSLDPIVNELAVDTFQFTVHYDPDAQRIAYSPVDMGVGVYRCAPDGSETHGVPGTLQSSGWANTRGTVTLSGNTFTLPSNDFIKLVTIRRPGGIVFSSGSVLKLAVEVVEITGDTYFYTMRNGSSANVAINESKTGLFTPNDYGFTVSGTGSDILTFRFNRWEDPYSNWASEIGINNIDRSKSATIRITGIGYNGKAIYGSPYGKIYLCRPTNPIPLDKYLTDVPYGTPVWWMCEES